MPICPKCGKSFSTEQALRYHLNKKYKCGTWRCGQCSTVFSTQFDLKIHKLSCESGRPVYVPSYDVLCKIYNNPSMIFVEHDKEGIVHSVSQGTKDDSEIVSGDCYRRSPNGEMVQCKRIHIDDNIFVDIII